MDDKMQVPHETIQEAIGNGNTRQILKLLNIDLGPLDKDSEGNTVLHHIINNENLPEKIITKILEIFLDDGIDPNTKNVRGETAVHLAVVKRMNDTIDLLIKYKATINADGRWFITHYFVENEYKKFWQISDNDEREIAEIQTATFVDWLISRGFDFHLRSDEQEMWDEISAFTLAEEFFLLHIITAVLENTKDLEFDSDIYYQDRKLFFGNLFVNGTYRLDYRHDQNWYAEYRRRHATNIMKILLDVTGPTEEERRVVFELALSSHELSVIEMMTNHFPEGCNERKFASIMFYLIMRHISIFGDSPAERKILKDLLDRGADVNAKDFCGRVPMYWALDLYIVRIPIVQFLKDNGADFQAVNRDGWNLLHKLADKDTRGAYFDDELEKLVDMLVNEDVQVNAKDNRGRTPLQVAVNQANYPATRALIFHGAEVDNIEGEGRKFCDHCLQKVKVLEETFVDGPTSIYRVLRMHRNRRYVYVNNVNLKKLVISFVPEKKFWVHISSYPRFLEGQFREYLRRIVWAYKEAEERYLLVERVMEAWLKLTEIDLPDECIERIFVYLSDQDLEAIIES